MCEQEYYAREEKTFYKLPEDIKFNAPHAGLIFIDVKYSVEPNDLGDMKFALRESDACWHITQVVVLLKWLRYLNKDKLGLWPTLL